MKRLFFINAFIFIVLIVNLIAQSEGDNSAMKRAYANPIPNNITGFGRDVYAGCDLDKDGKPEIIMTQYANGGAVEIFEVTENNIMVEVWRSADLGSPYTTSLRTLAVGDLDGDGIEELYGYLSTGSPVLMKR